MVLLVGIETIFDYINKLIGTYEIDFVGQII